MTWTIAACGDGGDDDGSATAPLETSGATQPPATTGPTPTTGPAGPTGDPGAPPDTTGEPPSATTGDPDPADGDTTTTGDTTTGDTTTGDTTTATTDESTTTTTGDTTGDTTSGTTGEGDAPGFAVDVWPIFSGACGCHKDSNGAGGLVLKKSGAYDALIGKPSSQLPAMALVEPGAPEQSYLWHKLDNTHKDVGGKGKKMPPGGLLDVAERQIVKAWIAQGAAP